jgi:hypothetical protein
MFAAPRQVLIGVVTSAITEEKDFPMLTARYVRLLFLAVFLCLIPASSFAGVAISINIAPPVMPVVVQPPCPQPGYIWTPGYWAYGPDGYYWVPGAWAPAPYAGALWTPGYWGLSGGLYIWHAGYWGPHVGFYGGINYGFGYFGFGYVGGEWRGGIFHYNTAVTRVNTTVVTNVYVNKTVIVNRTVVNNRVSFNGPGGVRYSPRAEERIAERDHHIEATRFQQQHEQTARSDHSAYFKNNGGRPANLAASRPLQQERHTPPPNVSRDVPRPPAGSGPRPATASAPKPDSRQAPRSEASNQHSSPAASKPAPQHEQHERASQPQRGSEGKQEHER